MGQRKVVLFSGFADLVDELLSPRRDQRAWAVWAMPLDLFEKLKPGTLVCGADYGYLSDALVRAGVKRDAASRFPQRIGFNVALKLTERGRVAFGLFDVKRDIFRATRNRVGGRNPRAVRVAPDELLAALRSAGQQLPKKAKRPETER